ncbi:hypothetical protein BDY24DRAFT_205686 [Mrakia frigida]|uniref:uncharacterized protein n=1 Tax=Mrakia frigida TaxID=29902 RepID=UPI003FCC0479
MPSPSPPFPLLPLEIKNHILRFCDPSTLAKTARVSLAFLELSSPILYEDVHIHGFEHLKLLFCSRSRPLSLPTAPFLSLSQIRDLSFCSLLEDVSPTTPSDYHLPLDRIPSKTSLLLRTCSFDFTYSANLHPHSHDPELLIESLCDLVDPLHLSLLGTGTGVCVATGVCMYPGGWNRLETLTLGSVDLRNPLRKTVASSSNFRQVTYDVSESEGMDLYGHIGDLAQDLPLPREARALVLVGSEEGKKKVLEQVAEERRDLDSGQWTDRKRALAQLEVQIKQST